MNLFQKIKTIISAFIMLFISIALIASPEEGYIMVIFILSILMILSGIKSLIYYFSMARHMVGGKSILYKGVILIDLGAFTIGLHDVSQVYVMIYLFVLHIFSGFISIMQAMESKKLRAPLWKLHFSMGIFNILIALICVFKINSINFAVYIYCFGLIYSAIIKIITAFKRTAIVYIQ